MLSEEYKSQNRNLFKNYLENYGLKIHMYTMRNEAKFVNQYKNTLFDSNYKNEILYFLENHSEISGYFTDFPKEFRQFLDDEVEFGS